MKQSLVNWYGKNLPFPPFGLSLAMRFLKNGPYIRKIHNDCLLLLDPSEHVQRQIFWHGYYEKKFVLTWEEMINEGDLVLDLGAAFGYYSIIASLKAARVVAFEPLESSRQAIAANLKLNDINNVNIEAYAVGDKNGSVSFYRSDAENPGMSGLQPAENSDGVPVEVRMIRLDDWVEQKAIGRIHFIKMDLEGSEMGALKGMQKTLAKWKPVLFIEISRELLQRFGHTPKEVFDFLSTLGYSSFQIVRRGKLRARPAPFEDELVVFR